LVETGLGKNAQLARIEAGIQAAGADVRATRSGYFPKVGFIGSLNGIVNQFDSGIVTPENKKSWALGVGVDIPVFQGFRVPNEVREARAKLRKLQSQRALLRDGIALEVKRTYFDLVKTQQQQASSHQAYLSATENRELNVRAYQAELVETSDVITAQLLEALSSGQYQKVLYDHVERQAKLDFVIGTDPEKLATGRGP
jgi:outer membrane protein TolC